MRHIAFNKHRHYGVMPSTVRNLAYSDDRVKDNHGNPWLHPALVEFVPATKAAEVLYADSTEQALKESFPNISDNVPLSAMSLVTSVDTTVSVDPWIDANGLDIGWYTGVVASPSIYPLPSRTWIGEYRAAAMVESIAQRISDWRDSSEFLALEYNVVLNSGCVCWPQQLSSKNLLPEDYCVCGIGISEQNSLRLCDSAPDMAYVMPRCDAELWRKALTYQRNNWREISERGEKWSAFCRLFSPYQQ